VPPVFLQQPVAPPLQHAASSLLVNRHLRMNSLLMCCHPPSSRSQCSPSDKESSVSLGHSDFGIHRWYYPSNTLPTVSTLYYQSQTLLNSSTLRLWANRFLHFVCDFRLIKIVDTNVKLNEVPVSFSQPSAALVSDAIPVFIFPLLLSLSLSSLPKLALVIIRQISASNISSK
jgi:hypothetical protein